VKSYFGQLSEINNELGLTVSEITLQIIMQLPTLFKITRDEPTKMNGRSLSVQSMKRLCP